MKPAHLIRGAGLVLLVLLIDACAALTPSALPSLTGTPERLSGVALTPSGSSPSALGGDASRTVPAPLSNATASPGTANVPLATRTETVSLPTASVAFPPSSAPQASLPTPEGSAIISFTAVPTTTLALGDQIQLRWRTRSGQVALCPYIMTPQGPAEQARDCSKESQEGSKNISVTEKDLVWNGMLLRVTTGQTTERSLVPLTLGCQGLRNWFFSPSPAKCPETLPQNSSAAAQPFEHGLMLWTQEPDRFYIIYDAAMQSGVFESATAPYSFRAGASPDNRVGETPPSGRYEPISGFGQVWRSEIEGLQNIRERLGWATAPEYSFNTAYQCELPNPTFRLWTCYLRRPDGKVLRLRPDSTAQVHFLWELWD